MKLEEEIHDTHARSIMLKSSRKNIDDGSVRCDDVSLLRIQRSSIRQARCYLKTHNNRTLMNVFSGQEFVLTPGKSGA